MPMHVVISVMSRDRAGIIAAVTKAVSELSGNIDAISQTVLRGYFTIILAVELPQPYPLDEIRKKVEAEGRQGELAVSIQQRDLEAARSPIVPDGEQFVLTTVGRDQPGVIRQISSYLASRNINIVDPYARVQAGEFVLIGQVMVPRQQDIQQIQIDLEAQWRDTAMTVNLQHQNIFVATNEIDFRHSKTAMPTADG